MLDFLNQHIYIYIFYLKIIENGRRTCIIYSGSTMFTYYYIAVLLIVIYRLATGQCFRNGKVIEWHFFFVLQKHTILISECSHMLIFNNSGIWCVTECSDFVDSRSSGKGCQTGKWCIEDKEERNQTPTSDSWDSMCIISSPSDGSQAGLLFSFWLLTWRGHCVYCNSTTQKGKATSVINVICNHLMKLSFKCKALTY